MKRYVENIKIKILLAFLFVSMGASFAKPKKLAVVDEIVGNAFLIEDGKTKQLRVGDFLTDFSEIMTEESAQVSFSDYYDHQYHLSGSGHVKILNKMIELVRGYLWVQSYRATKIPFMVQTANAVIKFYDGESIISFDSYSGKTQIMVVKGDFRIGNILHKQRHFDVDIGDGEFSSVDNELHGGNPRTTTPVGYKSFQKVLSLFSGIKPLDEDNDLYREVKRIPKKEKQALKVARKMAVGKKERDSILKKYIQQQVPEKKTNGSGKFIYLRLDKKARERGKDTFTRYYGRIIKKLEKEKKKKKVVKFKPSYKKKSGVPIYIFTPRVSFPVPGKKLKRLKRKKNLGRAKGRYSKKMKRQAKRKRVYKRKSRQQLQRERSEFEKTLVNEYKNQMRHSEEVNSLIEDLKSYEQDYKKNY